MPAQIVTTVEHYDRMIDEIDDPAYPVGDPFWDAGTLCAWMAQTDGPAFLRAVGAVRGQALLEVGIGTGRVAQRMLEQGCASLTGIDLSAKSLARARDNLAGDPRVALLQADIGAFVRKGAFDVAYSVWTFCHIADKPRALANLVASLKPGGRLVLSLEAVGDWLDYGPRRVRLYPSSCEQYIVWLEALGCTVEPPAPVYDAFTGGREDTLLTTILCARPN